MVFSSVTFLFLFLPVVLGLYALTFVLPSRLGFRKLANTLGNLTLLAASLLFYTWGEQVLVLVMIACAVVDYTCGLLMAGDGRLPVGPIQPIPPAEARSRRRKAILIGSLLFNLGTLAVFKYFNFGVDSALAILNWLDVDSPFLQGLPAIALPIGISFYTFQSMSYTIDVYRGHVAATRNFLNYGTLVTLFPQLVAGPIVRYAHVQEQLRSREVTADRFGEGVERFIVGLGKKVLIANTVAATADQVFALPAEQLHFGIAWIGILCYTLQIYYDFSGYSDMAIGLGRMLGFTFLENFQWPYASRSIKEFWRRWHISLSTWFRDYVYIPLGGSHVSPVRQYFNLWLVFLLCGLWHGASWTFILWGAWHGFFLVLERGFLGRFIERRSRISTNLYAFFVVMLGWVLFRAETLDHAIAYYGALFGLASSGLPQLPLNMVLNSDVLVAIVIGVLFSFPTAGRIGAWLSGSERPIRIPEPALVSVRLAVYTVLFFTAALQLSAGTYNPFIYFRF